MKQHFIINNSQKQLYYSLPAGEWMKHHFFTSSLQDVIG